MAEYTIGKRLHVIFENNETETYDMSPQIRALNLPASGMLPEGIQLYTNANSAWVEMTGENWYPVRPRKQ